MAVTVTVTNRTAINTAGEGTQRISRKLAMALLEVALTGTYATGGFSLDLGAYFKTDQSMDVHYVGISIDDASANAAGYFLRYDYTNAKVKIYAAASTDTELSSGTELGTTGLSFTKIRVMAVGNQG